MEWIGGQKSLEVRDLVIITYENFCTSVELLLKIIKRFMIPWPLGMSTKEVSEMLKERYKIIQNRILGFLQYWISVKLNDFTKTQEPRIIIDTWIECMKKDTEYYKLNSKQIQGQILPILKKADEQIHASNLHGIGANFDPKDVQLPLSIVPYSSLVFGSGLLSYPTELIATQLALIDQNLFCKLRPKDFLTKKSAKKGKSATDHLTRRINYFGSFLSIYLLKEPSQNIRDALIDKYLDIIKKSLEINNINCAYMVFNTLFTYESIENIFEKDEKGERPKTKQEKEFDELKKCFSSDKNFKSIKELTKSKDPPCVPCFHLWGKDMDTISQLYPNDFIGEDKKMIDLQRQAKIADHMKELEFYQRVRYNFYKCPVLYNFLESDFEACMYLNFRPNDVTKSEYFGKLKRSSKSGFIPSGIRTLIGI